MKVILLNDVKGMGKEGDLVNAKPGYFNNFLAKNQLAVEATPQVVKRWKQEQKEKAQQEKENRAQAEALKAKLEASEITLKAKSGSEGKLFGSVTAADISQALEEQLGLSIDKKKLELAESIRTTGTTEVAVRVYPEMLAKLKVHVEEE